MPRIRKKTSRRGTTAKRASIKHKVAESRKKSKKSGKKEVQWKSKHKKDPGIPNNFPYKEQILAEVAAERRQAAEEKQRRKDVKKAAKEDLNAEAGGAAESGDESGAAFDGVLNVKAGSAAKASKKSSTSVKAVVEEGAVPFLINRGLSTFQAVLDEADVILEVVDARDPLAYRSSHIEELVASKAGKPLIIALNKIDTCPREVVSAWLTTLRRDYPAVPFRSASACLPALPSASAVNGKGKEKESWNDAEGVESLKKTLSRKAQEKKENEPLTVAVVGVTNSGKSALINSLLQKPCLPVYSLAAATDGPSTTTLVHEVTMDLKSVTKHVRFLDTPGLVWTPDAGLTSEAAETTRARDILLRNKGRIDRLKDPLPTVAQIVSRANTEDLMLFYNLPAFVPGDTDAFLTCLARANRMIKKSGHPDLTTAARIVLRDWSTGKLPHYTAAPDAAAKAMDTADKLSMYDAEDESVLARLRTRKEMRIAGGLVKLVPGSVESRPVAVDAPWPSFGGDEGSSDEGTEEGNAAFNGDGEDEDEDEDADEDENDAEDDEDEDDDEVVSEEDEEDEAAPLPSKRKRKAQISLAPPPKKVAFATDPKESRKARRAASKGNPKALAPTATSKAKPKVKAPAVKAPSRPLDVAAAKQKDVKAANGEEAYDFNNFF